MNLHSGMLSCKPHCLISNCVENSTLNKRLSVVLILPSGVGSGNFNISVLAGGGLLQLYL